MTSDPIARFLSQRAAKFDRRTRLRTMDSHQIVDTGLRVYQILGWTFLKLTTLPSLLCLASLAFATEFILPSMFVTQDAGNRAVQMGEVATALAMGLFIGGPLLLIGLSYSTALVAQLVSDYMVGNVPSPDAARQTARKMLPTIFKVNIRVLLLSSSGLLLSIGLLMLSSYLDQATSQESASSGLVFGIGILGICAGGIVLLVVIAREALSTPAAVLEGLKARDAGRRSHELLKATPFIPSGYNTVASLYVVIAIVSAIMIGGLYGSLSLIDYQQNAESVITSLPLGPLILKAAELLPLYLFVWTMIPVWAVSVTIIYYERRVRKEGYDIEALAGDVWRTDRQNRFEL